MGDRGHGHHHRPRYHRDPHRDGAGMLLSIFADVPGGPVWVISHIGYGEDSYTTILLAEE